jgi:hypothetical protein
MRKYTVFFKEPPCKIVLLNLSKQKFSNFRFFWRYNIGGMPARYTLCAHCICASSATQIFAPRSALSYPCYYFLPLAFANFCPPGLANI